MKKFMQNDLSGEKAQIFSANQRNLNGKCLDADELKIFSAFFFIQSTYKSKQHSNVKSPSCAIDACSSFGFLWIVNFVLSSNSEKIVVKIFSALHNFRRPLISRSQSIVIGEKSANFIELARVLARESR